MEKQENHKNQGIQVISRAASVLRLLGDAGSGLSLGQIAREVELPRSTVQRIVSALALEGLVSTGGGAGRIKLGPEIQKLAISSVAAPRDRLRPIMQQIADETGETVDLAVLQGNKMLFVDQIVGKHRLRTVSSIGEAFPLTTTANGKAALACLSKSEASALVAAELKALRAGAERLSGLLAEIDGIRNGAIATDEDEHTEGVSALGIGFPDPSGDTFALSIPVPSSRYSGIKDDLIGSLQRAKVAASVA